MLNNRYNLFLLTRTILLTYWYADWEGAYQNSGILGLISEFFRSLVGVNTWPFFIDSKGGWDRAHIQKLFAPYHIKMWGWGYSQGQFFFRVKKRQAHWSQDILLENNVPIRGRLLRGHSNTQSSSSPTTKHKPPVVQRPNSKPNQQGPQSRPAANTSTPFNLLDEVNKIADKFAGL